MFTMKNRESMKEFLQIDIFSENGCRKITRRVFITNFIPHPVDDFSSVESYQNPYFPTSFLFVPGINEYIKEVDK